MIKELVARIEAPAREQWYKKGFKIALITVLNKNAGDLAGRRGFTLRQDVDNFPNAEREGAREADRINARERGDSPGKIVEIGDCLGVGGKIAADSNAAGSDLVRTKS